MMNSPEEFVVTPTFICLFILSSCEQDEFAVNEKYGTIYGPYKGDHVDQGDIMFIKDEEETLFAEDKGNNKKEITAFQERKWPLPVPYEIDSDMSAIVRNGIMEGIKEIEAKTCIKFRRRNEENEDYINFIEDEGCWSYIGRKGGKQEISLAYGCHSKKKAIHEIMHALGFFHEQTRSDRDDFVKIHLDNVFDWAKNNFRKLKSEDVMKINHPYDYESVMHYSRTAFSRNGKDTISVRNDRKQRLGQPYNGGLSENDAMLLDELYCGSTTTPETSTTSNVKSTSTTSQPTVTTTPTSQPTATWTKETNVNKLTSTSSNLNPTPTSIGRRRTVSTSRRRATTFRRRRSLYRRRRPSYKKRRLFHRRQRSCRRRSTCSRSRSRKRKFHG